MLQILGEYCGAIKELLGAIIERATSQFTFLKINLVASLLQPKENLLVLKIFSQEQHTSTARA